MFRKVKFGISFLLLSTLCLLLGYVTAFGWSTLTSHWPARVTYTYSYGSDFSTDGKNSIDRGATPWNLINNSKPKFNFQTTSTPNNITTPTKNGKNEIFKISNGTNSYLAQTTRWYSGNTTQEADIALNVSYLWSNDVSNCPSGSYDVASVFTHEFGHVAGLDHSGFGVAIMYYTLSSGTIKTSLTSDDVDGYNNIAWNT